MLSFDELNAVAERAKSTAEKHIQDVLILCDAVLNRSPLG